MEKKTHVFNVFGSLNFGILWFLMPISCFLTILVNIHTFGIPDISSDNVIINAKKLFSVANKQECSLLMTSEIKFDFVCVKKLS